MGLVNNDVLQKHTIRTLAITQILTGIGVVSTIAAGSLLVSSISHSESLAGLAQTFNVLGAATMAIPLASLTHRGGRRLALSTGYVIATIGSISAIIGGSHRILFFMLAGTFMIGASSAANYQSRFAAVDLSHPESRARDLSFVVWASTIGAVLGPNLMAPFGSIAPYFGLPRLTGPYLLAAVMLGIATLNVWFRLKPDPYLTHITQTHGENVKPPARLSARVVLARMKKSPRTLLGLMSIAIGHLAMVSIMVMTPVHMSHVDVSLKIIGLVISVHVAGMYAFSPIVGKLADRMGRIRVIQIGAGILLLSGLIAGTADAGNSVQLGCGLFLLGVGWSCTLIAGSTLLTETIDDDIRASAQGATDLVMNLCAAGGGALAGLIIATLSYGFLCAFVCVPVAFLGYRATRLAAAA